MSSEFPLTYIVLAILSTYVIGSAGRMLDLVVWRRKLLSRVAALRSEVDQSYHEPARLTRIYDRLLQLDVFFQRSLVIPGLQERPETTLYDAERQITEIETHEQSYAGLKTERSHLRIILPYAPLALNLIWLVLLGLVSESGAIWLVIVAGGASVFEILRLRWTRPSVNNQKATNDASWT